ncbi:MAG: alpha-L-rhamnosidase N-terminal domain-containing protein, partial [Kiritimatiellae bacterium]|nr:alpha-L-rhamnosidase N-terminal domain-containing protein [Kiritimatiellia bacterium]
MKRMVLAALPALLAGCDPEIPMAAALDGSAWDCSQWISAADATPVDDAIRESQRAADGLSWFVLEDFQEAKVESVKWMTTALGVYEIYLNGKRVGQEALKPGFTHAHKTRRSFTYDVTPLYRQCETNFFAAEVSAGWWCDQVCGFQGKVPAFRSVVEFTFSDGTKKLVGTSVRNWKAAVAGNIVHAAIFDGEECDARIAPPYSGSPFLKQPVA